MNPAAIIVVQVAIGSAVALAIFFAVLIVRRQRLERREAEHRLMRGQITRHYLQRVGGFPADTPRCAWPDDIKLSAVSHLHLLLRGGERERLMQMAELDGLLRKTIEKSASIRAARRIDSIRLLQQFGSEACIARLRAMLTTDRSDTVRIEAAFALAALRALPPPRELIRILGLFNRKPNRLDAALLRSTAQQYTDHLLHLLNDPMPHWRRALIVDALGWSADPSVLPTLRRAARTDNAELRSAALRASAKLGSPAADKWIIPLLRDPVPFVRLQAANSCAALGLNSAVPQLRRMLEDEDLWVRLRAEHALDVLVANWPSDQAFKEVA